MLSRGRGPHVFVVALRLLTLFLPEECGERDEDDDSHDGRDDDGDDGCARQRAVAAAAHAAARWLDPAGLDVERQRAVTHFRFLGLHEPQLSEVCSASRDAPSPRSRLTESIWLHQTDCSTRSAALRAVGHSGDRGYETTLDDRTPSAPATCVHHAFVNLA